MGISSWWQSATDWVSKTNNKINHEANKLNNWFLNGGVERNVGNAADWVKEQMQSVKETVTFLVEQKELDLSEEAPVSMAQSAVSDASPSAGVNSAAFSGDDIIPAIDAVVSTDFDFYYI